MALDPKDIAKEMLSPVNETGEAGELLQKNVDLLNEIKDIINDFSDKFAEAADDAEKYLDELEEANKSLEEQKRTAKKALKSESTQEKILKATQKASARARQPSPTAAVGSGTRAKGNARAISTRGSDDGAEYGHEFAHSFGHAVEMTMNSVMLGFLGGASAYQLLTNDMIEQEYLFAQGMKRIAFQTQAITGQMPKMQKAFRATSDVVRSTGFDLTTYQNTLLEASKKGLKDTQSIVRTGLQLGKMMGMTEQESAQIAQQFGEWSLHLGTDSLMLADISRGMQDITRQTGLVGQNLIEVTKQTERFMLEMRNAGNLTASSAKNMMLLVAEAKKLGVAESMSEVLSGMTSASKLLLGASEQTKTQLFLAASYGGVTEELMTGTLTKTKAGMKGMAEGMRKMFANISGGAELTEEAIRNMSPEQRRNVDIALTSITGKGIEEFRREMEALDRAGMTYKEALTDIDKQLGVNATAEEKRNAELKKQQLLMSKSFEFSTLLADTAKGATSFEDAVTKMQKSMTDLEWQEKMTDLSQVAGTFSKDLERGVMQGNKDSIAKAMALSAAESLKDAGGGDFTGRVGKALKNNDLSKLREVQEEMNEAQQKLGVDQITALDPMDRAALYLKEMNENIRFFVGPAIVGITSMVGSLGLIAGMMATSAAGMIFKVETIKAWLDVLNVGINKVLGRGFKQVGEKVATNAFTGMAGAMGGAARGTAAAGAGAAATGGGVMASVGATARALAPIAPWLIAIGAAAGGIVGNISAGAKAMEIFDTTLEDLTYSQYYAAKGAGSLTGALNFLTLGIFNNWLKADGAVTKAIAKFNQFFPLLSMLAAILDVLAGIVWGVVLAVKNVIKGIGQGIAAIWEPIGEVLSAVWEAVSAFLSIFNIFGASMGETGSLFTMVSQAIGVLGKALGWVFKIIGKIIGGVIRIFLNPLILFFKRLKAIFTGDFSSLADEIKTWLWKGFGFLFYDLPLMIIKGWWKVAKFLYYDLPLMAIKGFFNAIKFVFIELPKKIWDWMMGGLKSLASNDWVGPIFQPFLDILTPLYEAMQGLWKALGELFHVFDPILNLIASLFGGGKGKKAGKNAESAFSWMELLQKVIYGLSTAIGWMLKMYLWPLEILFKGLAFIVEKVTKGIQWLTSKLKIVVDVVVWVGEKIISIFKGIWDKILSSIPGFVKRWLGIGNEAEKEKEPAAKAAPKKVILPAPAGPGARPIGNMRNPNIIESPYLTHRMGLNDAAAMHGVGARGATTQAQAARGATAAQPGSMVDVHDKMQREQAGTVAASKQKTGPANDLIAINQNQLEYLMLMHGDLEKVIDLLTPDKTSGQSGVELASTKTNTKPINSPDYHKWQIGRSQQNASTNIVTDGR
ncbi:MAG: hypothetical protein DWQ19_12620 [Crenarchaeota archaeon]|nr:MAG: hypothetical protein DWQ19_12620 [Thermoproteota archaeon]